MPSRVSGKQRASRIQLDYHVRPGRLVVVRSRLTLLAAAATISYLGWGLFTHGTEQAAFSPGPVAAPHAIWDPKCAACHEPFLTMRAASWHRDETRAGAQIEKRSDRKCQVCHPGPPHHSTQKDSEVVSCAGCHQEHRGHLASLTRIDDRACTACHSTIAAHTLGTPELENPLLGNVTRFDRVHPEFRSLRTDPGTIKFTHQRHMRSGLKSSDKDRFEFTSKELPEQDRNRYRPNQEGRGGKAHDTDADDNETQYVLQLQCATCHQLDSTRVPSHIDHARESPPFSARSAGAYMLPVTYEKDCKACHPLAYQPGSTVRIEHGRTPEQIREVLASHFWENYLKQNPEIADHDLHRPAFPGRPSEPELVKAMAAIDEWVAGAERHLRVSCVKCHDLQESAEPKLQLPAVLPSNIPHVWLQHARFNHTAHRALKCDVCHPQALTSNRNSDVLIGGRDTCVKCHSPATSDGLLGGARYGCVECHRYHAGEEPRHGLSGKSSHELDARLRGQKFEMSLIQFLRGDSKP